MNKYIAVILGIIVLILIGNGIYASMNNRGGVTLYKEVENKDSVVTDNMNVGSYEAYATEKLARAETGDVVLFFHASWCPSCRGLNSDIEKNLSAIPKGVSILKTDYDQETELKKKYGITYQHTLVQVDKDGNMVKKWSGSPTLASLISQIK